VRFFSLEEIRKEIESGTSGLSDNFVHEIKTYLEQTGR
jgi:hypothetical protein